MRSVSFDTFGSPAKVMHTIERDRPEPGPGQARVRMVMSPIHNHDLMIVTGHYGFKPDLPHVPGTEALGVVDALGEGVTELEIGRRVAGGASHAWSEYYLVDARRAVPVPDEVPDETACQLLSMPLSARMLLEDFDVKPGEWIVQNAANGAVGKTLAGLAADHGVNVVGLVRRAAAVAELADQGIENVVSTEDPDWRERVGGITGGASIVRGLDSIGGKAADEVLSVMGEGSTLFSFGALSGRPLQVSADNLLFKQAAVRGFWLTARLKTADPALLARLTGEIVAKAARGGLVLPVAASYPLADIAAAAEASATAGRGGKIVLTP